MKTQPQTTAITDPREQQAQQEIATVQNALSPIAKRWAKVTEIENISDYALVAQDLKLVKTLMAQDKTLRSELISPLKGVIKKLEAILSPASKALDGWEASLKSLLVGYDIRERARNLALAEKAAKKVEKKSPELAQDMRDNAQAAQASPAIEGIQVRRQWTFKIVDEHVIPREFLIVDEKKLALYARALKEHSNVNGVEFFQESIIAASAE